ncbi:MAG: hypothetical protein DK306_001304 [Chloroflexi bacterium]|nr:MAG: hypothetical protein DK306_001304 [Chloroflexota bacterium]
MNTAEGVLDLHRVAINDRDLEAYRATMHFPFTYQNYSGVALTIATAADVGSAAQLPWNIILRSDPKWRQTTFDTVEAVARSVSSAVFKVRFRRIDDGGRASGAYQAIWIATFRDGRWGIQFRHNLGLEEA